MTKSVFISTLPLSAAGAIALTISGVLIDSRFQIPDSRLKAAEPDLESQIWNLESIESRPVSAVSLKTLEN
jgi:hypothetical protein